MLSGLTSQFSGLITGNKNTEDPNTASTTAEETTPKSRSGSTSEQVGGAAQPTSAASGILNFRPSLPTWLGGGKDSETTPTPAPTQTTEEDAHSDASSATGGADSDKERIRLDAELTAKESTSDKPAPTDRVKNLGSMLFSGIKSAGQKIKDTAKSSIGGGSGQAPWVGFTKEAEFKEEILSLSNDRRNFVRSPPVAFDWNYEESLPTAKAILKEDPNLEKMRFDLVPKVVTEENFWRNYFYRVMLLKESLESAAGVKKQDSIDTDEEDEPADAELEKELEKELGFEVVKSEEKLDLK